MKPKLNPGALLVVVATAPQDGMDTAVTEGVELSGLLPAFVNEPKPKLKEAEEPEPKPVKPLNAPVEGELSLSFPTPLRFAFFISLVLRTSLFAAANVPGSSAVASSQSKFLSVK